jgi:HK97 family phage major capsid protein
MSRSLRSRQARRFNWIPENSDITASNPTFSLAGTLSPKRATVEVIVSNQLLKQSAMAIDQVVVNNFRRALAVAYNSAALVGTGSSNNMPLGLTGLSGIPTVAFSGAATYTKVLSFEKTLELANVEANESSAWITSVTTKNVWRQKPIITGYPKFLWNGEDNTVAGYTAIATTLLESNNTAIFGRFDNLVIGTFGAIGLVTDPYSLAEYAKTRFIITLLIDCLVSHTESFCFSSDSASQ